MFSNVLFLVLLLTSVSLRQSRSAAFVTTKMSFVPLAKSELGVFSIGGISDFEIAAIWYNYKRVCVVTN